MNYGKWLTEWLETTVKPFKKSRTYQKYRKICDNNLAPRLGKFELGELSLPVLQSFTSELVQSYAPGTVTLILAVLKSSLKHAEEMGIAAKFRYNLIRAPRYDAKEVVCLSQAQQKQLEEYILSGKKYKLYGIVLCLYTGLRIGELMAAEWSDVNFDKCIITVNKSCYDSWQGGEYKKIVESPKTRSSRRIVPLPKSLIKYLKEYKRHSTGKYLISGSDGKEISVRSYQRTFELLLKKLNIPHMGFHSLRHTFATRAMECGMDVKSLSEILGHKSPTVTLSRYVHSFMEYKAAMINKLGKNL